MFALSKRLTDAFSLRFARAVRETYREDEAYASTPWAASPSTPFSSCSSSSPPPRPLPHVRGHPGGHRGPLRPGPPPPGGGRGADLLRPRRLHGGGGLRGKPPHGPPRPLGDPPRGRDRRPFGASPRPPSLRIKGVYLAIATLAFQFLADYVFKTWEAVTGGSGAGPFLPRGPGPRPGHPGEALVPGPPLRPPPLLLRQAPPHDPRRAGLPGGAGQRPLRPGGRGGPHPDQAPRLRPLRLLRRGGGGFSPGSTRR